MSGIDQQITELAQRVADEFDIERLRTGQLPDLETDDKTSFVAAINELLTRISQAGGVVIDDNGTSSSKVWSSSKTNGTINDAVSNLFGDSSAVANNKVWSSQKTQSSINDAIAGLAAGVNQELENYATKTYMANAISQALQPYSTSTEVGQMIEDAIDALTIPVIDDAGAATDRVWSSSKVAQEIDDAIAGLPTIYQIDDADDAGASNKLWSSLKVKNMLAALINDSVVALTTTWSSTKIRAFIMAQVAGLWDDRGNYDASTNLFPATGGSAEDGGVLKSDIWTINAPGTLGGVAVAPGQTVRALADAPGQTASNWAISSSGLSMVDDSITDGITGRAPSQNAVYDALQLKENLLPTGGTTAQYLRGDKTLSDLFADVRTVTLLGLSFATTTSIALNDTLMVAFGKLQGQINTIKTQLLGVATLAGAETLSSKTLTAPIINGFTEGGSQIASTATTVVLWTNTDTEIATTGDFICQLPAPVVGKSATITIVYNGAHTPTFTIASGTLRMEDNSEAVVGVNGKIETWAIKSLRGSTTLLLSKTGEYTP